MNVGCWVSNVCGATPQQWLGTSWWPHCIWVATDVWCFWRKLSCSFVSRWLANQRKNKSPVQPSPLADTSDIVKAKEKHLHSHKHTQLLSGSDADEESFDVASRCFVRCGGRRAPENPSLSCEWRQGISCSWSPSNEGCLMWGPIFCRARAGC